MPKVSGAAQILQKHHQKRPQSARSLEVDGGVAKRIYRATLGFFPCITNRPNAAQSISQQASKSGALWGVG